MLPGGFSDLDNLVKEKLQEWTYDAGEEALARMGDLDERGSSRLIGKLAWYFENSGAYDRAEPLYEQALAISNDMFVLLFLIELWMRFF